MFRLSAQIIIAIALTGCGLKPMVILNGATHAFGTVHLEGFATDSEADMVLVKAPVTWTPEQVDEFIRLRNTP